MNPGADPASETGTWRKWIPYLLVFGIGLALRLILIGSKSLWVDEAYAAGLMDRSLQDLVSLSTTGSPHPPLAFIFIRLSVLLFGAGEAGLRMMSALCSAMASIPLMMFVSRKLDRRSALWAGLVWVVSPFAVSLGQEAWIYGLTAFLGFMFIDIADRAWHGCRKAMFALLPVALIGMLVQHLFGLYIIAGFSLYFTVPSGERLRISRFAILLCLFVLLYSPFGIPMLRQAAFRAERLSRAGLDMAQILRYRFLIRIPTVFARLIPGGLLVEAGRRIIGDTKQIVFWCIFGAGQLLLLLNLFLKSRLEVRTRIWLLLLFAVPFMMFLKEDPTVRHLTILWIPLAFSIAAAARRWKYAGPVILAAAALMLLPYYNIGSFPYHRSDWRLAVRFVEERAMESDGILVLGGQSGGLAWDYYSRGDIPRAALGGEDPYSENMTPGRSPGEAIDSLLRVHPHIWIVHDYWGGPCASRFAAGHEILLEQRVSPAMEILRISGE